MTRLLVIIAMTALLSVGACGDSTPKSKPHVSKPKPKLKPKPKPKPTKIASQPSADRPDAPMRRGRAGIEPAPEEPVVAKPAPDPKVAPALKTTREFAAAKRAYAWIKARWMPAITSRDVAAYSALLLSGFRGGIRVPKKGLKSLARGPWLERFKAGKAPTKITWGPPETDVLPGPFLRVTMRFPERRLAKGACTTRERSLTVHVGPKGAPKLASDFVSASRPCGAAQRVDLAAFHTQLKRKVKQLQEVGSELAETRLAVREHGLAVLRVTPNKLEDSDGAWILTALKVTDADLDNTEVFGTRGVVRGSEGIAFVYARSGDSWKLLGVNRVAVTASNPGASPKAPPKKSAPSKATKTR